MKLDTGLDYETQIVATTLVGTATGSTTNVSYIMPPVPFASFSATIDNDNANWTGTLSPSSL